MTFDTLGTIGSYGLPGAAPVSIGPLGAPEWGSLLRAAVDQRAVPLVAHAAAGGCLETSSAQWDELTSMNEQSMHACVRLERAALEVVWVLRGAGIPHRLLKGAAVAHLDYPDASWRAFGDVDVLVRADRYDDAIHVLERLGGRRRYSEVRPGFDSRWGKGACVVLDRGVQVDVHRSFVAGPFGLTIDLNDLFAVSEAVLLGGVEVDVLSREHRLLHACYHALLGDAPARLVPLRDVAQMALSGTRDWEELWGCASRWHSRAVVARAMHASATAMNVILPEPARSWTVDYVADRFEARSLDAYLGPGRSYARQMAAGVHAVRGLGAKLAYVRSMLAVDADYARRHDGGYRRRVQRAWRAQRSAGAAR
ncbi:MAG: nucleotidyltransferase family protein [Actinobacteria bacterium]|nr:nucleotidyltransferase family protein [Actinomycetota bacterium]